MSFVEDRVSCRNCQSGDSPTQLPSLALPAHPPEQKNAEQEIFYKVCRLADETVQQVKGIGACGGKQPVQHRNDNTARVAGSECLGGGAGNYYCPHDCGEPWPQTARQALSCGRHY